MNTKTYDGNHLQIVISQNQTKDPTRCLQIDCVSVREFTLKLAGNK